MCVPKLLSLAKKRQGLGGRGEVKAKIQSATCRRIDPRVAQAFVWPSHGYLESHVFLHVI